MGFLTGFDRDVEIVVRRRKKTGKPGRITFHTVAAKRKPAGAGRAMTPHH